jgi:hypothetical protein
MCDTSLIDPKPSEAVFTLMHHEVDIVEVSP